MSKALSTPSLLLVDNNNKLSVAAPAPATNVKADSFDVNREDDNEADEDEDDDDEEEDDDDEDDEELQDASVGDVVLVVEPSDGNNSHETSKQADNEDGGGGGGASELRTMRKNAKLNLSVSERRYLTKNGKRWCHQNYFDCNCLLHLHLQFARDARYFSIATNKCNKQTNKQQATTNPS